MRIASLFGLIVIASVSSLFAAPALAQRDRVFVASYGSDANPCTFGSPCKTFQNAVNVVAAGGEVTAIDSAGFGSISITKSVTITSPNGVEAGIAPPESGAAAITIAAASTAVIDLSGLTLDGDGVSNTTGIDMQSGGTLNIQNSVIRNFGAAGVMFEPNTAAAGADPMLSIIDTVISNATIGIDIAPLGTANSVVAIDRVRVLNCNTYGLVVQPQINGSTSTLTVDFSNSVIENNALGVQNQGVSGWTQSLMIRNSEIANNTFTGVAVNGSDATVWLTRSTIAENATAWVSNDGILLSFNDNNIIGNTNGNPSPATTGYK
jgi:hypothetical protein